MGKRAHTVLLAPAESEYVHVAPFAQVVGTTRMGLLHARLPRGKPSLLLSTWSAKPERLGTAAPDAYFVKNKTGNLLAQNEINVRVIICKTYISIYPLWLCFVLSFKTTLSVKLFIKIIRVG